MLERLAELKCETGQGDLFGLPGSAAATTVALRTVRNEMRRSA
ncbi:MAG: hypothetical protein WA717_13355 [Methyloceanibacter sp.]